MTNNFPNCRIFQENPTAMIDKAKPMALTNCKECNKEISTKAKVCPYCGIDNLGVYDQTNRRVGFFVLILLILLFLYIFPRQEWGDYRDTKIAGISEKREADVAKAAQDTHPATSLSEQPKPKEAPVKVTSVSSQQSSTQISPLPSANREQPEQKKAEPDKTWNIATEDTPQMMVMRMLEYALNDGGLGHESEIQQIKLELQNSPRPAKGNLKEARAINAKALAALKKGDFNNAVKMLEEAYKFNKSDSEIINNLGFSYLKQGNLDSAQQTIIIALTLSPDRSAAWENLGEVYGIKGDVRKAVACFSNAYRFSKDRLKMHQFMKKINENEEAKNLKQARALAINWADKSYLKTSKKAESKK